jgi:hypothetical protein
MFLLLVWISKLDQLVTFQFKGNCCYDSVKISVYYVNKMDE